jgi:hypothetical protein
MRIVNELLRDERDHQRRVGATRAAFAANTRDEQRLLVAEFIREVERSAAASRKPRAPRIVSNDVAPPTRPKLFVDQVEEYVLGNQDGVTVEDVAAVTGQSERSAYGTLRHAERTRGTLAHRSDGRWYPTGKVATERPSDKTVRDYITAALTGSQPLGTGNVYATIERAFPGAVVKSSVATEIARMKAVRRARGRRRPLPQQQLYLRFDLLRGPGDPNQQHGTKGRHDLRSQVDLEAQRRGRVVREPLKS